MKRNFKRLNRSRNRHMSWIRILIQMISGNYYPYSCLKCGEQISNNNGYCRSCGSDQFIAHSEYIHTPNHELIEEKKEREKIQKQRIEEIENQKNAELKRMKFIKLAEEKWRELLKARFCVKCHKVINVGDFCEKCGTKLVALSSERKENIMMKEFGKDLTQADLAGVYLLEIEQK